MAYDEQKCLEVQLLGTPARVHRNDVLHSYFLPTEIIFPEERGKLRQFRKLREQESQGPTPSIQKQQSTGRIMKPTAGCIGGMRDATFTSCGPCLGGLFRATALELPTLL